MSRLARAIGARPDEAGAALWAFAQMFFVLAGLFVLRPVRDEMGIAGGVERLPHMFTATFVVILLVVPVWGMAVARLGRRTLVPAAHLALGVAFAGFWLLFVAAPEWLAPWLARALFVWISVFNMLAVSVSWSLAVDVFGAGAARRLFGFVAAGASTGALVGPAVTSVLAPRFGPAPLLLVAAASLACAALCAGRLARATAAREADDRPIGGGLLAGFRLLLGSPVLLGLAAYVVMYTVTSTILYIGQARIVGEAIADPGERTALFARMELAVNLAAVVTQLAITHRLIARLGIAAVLASLPLASVLALGAVALAPTVWVIVVVQVGRRALEFALAKPGRELLYVGLDRESKYKAKNVIDTVVYRGGDAAAAWAFAAVLAAGLGLSGACLLGVALSLGWVVQALALGRR